MTVQPSSASVERLFSVARAVINDEKQSALKIDARVVASKSRFDTAINLQ